MRTYNLGAPSRQNEAKYGRLTRTVPISRIMLFDNALALWFSMMKHVVTGTHNAGSKRSARNGKRVNPAHKVSAKDT